MLEISEKVLEYAQRDGISPRYLQLKQKGLIKYDVGALKAKEQGAEALSEGKNILLRGDVGLGKSFLAFELMFDFKCKTAGYGRFYYNRASVLYGDFKSNFSNITKTLDSVFSKDSFIYGDPVQSCKFVIIDEIDDMPDYSIVDEIIISAYDKLVPIVLIGNLTPDELADKLCKKAFSRFRENALILQIKGKDLRGFETPFSQTK